MDTIPIFTLSLIAVCDCGRAQEPPARGGGDGLPAFEVASVKPSLPVQRRLIVDGVPVFRRPPNVEGGPGTNAPGQITCSGCLLAAMVATAYEVGPRQIHTAQNVSFERYDLIAKVPAGSTRHQVNLMLRQFLTERFQLTVHIEKQDAPAYVLVAGKQGPKFQPPDSAIEPDRSVPDGSTLRPELSGSGLYTIIGKHRSMRELAGALSLAMNHPVLDKTELKGDYDFSLAWMFSERQPQPKKSELPAGIKTAPYTPEVAVQVQLGLKLEIRKVPVDMLIIESALNVPIEN